MNRRSKIRALVGVVGLAFGMYGSGAFAAISGSAHDFRGDTWNVAGTEICNVCHTPHNATAAAGPLWNHATSAVATYTVYDSTQSSTLNATVGQPQGISKLCLSCHDGTVALENFGAVTTGATLIGSLGTGNFEVGTDLSNDHPISFTYDAALVTADGGGLNAPSATLPLFGIDQLECATCHDVHNKDGNAKLLRVANTGSALCLTCHAK